MTDPPFDLESPLEAVLRKVRELAREVRRTARRVHNEAEESRRLAAIARRHSERGRQLSETGRCEARAIEHSVGWGLGRAHKAERRLSGDSEG